MNVLKHAVAKRAMVVSGHDDATRAALSMLEHGGSLADAALAGAAVLSVVLPHACGLGGDAFMLVHDAASGETHGLNASGMSPALAASDVFPDGIAERGPRSCNVPGMVAGWQALHARYGKKAWKDVLAMAIRAAHTGVVVSPVLARASVMYQDMLDAASKALFLPDGKPLVAGQMLLQPQAAQTLETIARDGAHSFYQGAIGASIARACAASGGLLRETDMVAYAPQWVEPIEIAYCGHIVRTMPPNSYGLYLLLQLMALDASTRAGGKGLTDSGRIIRLMRAAQAAFDVGARAVADPDPRYGADSVQQLLGPDGRKRLETATGGRPGNLGGTAVISVADHHGNAVTVIQSVFLVFGSGVSDLETGVLLNNRLFGFTLQQGHPNVVGPHKRPAHTLSPAMVFKGTSEKPERQAGAADRDGMQGSKAQQYRGYCEHLQRGRPPETADARGAVGYSEVSKHGHLRYVMTTPGGPGQTLTLAQVMQAVFEEHASLAQAIQTPRWTMDLAGHALLEHTMPQAVIAAVRAQGESVSAAEPGSPYFGSVKGIALEDDATLIGVADDRRDATVRGLS